MGNDTIPTPWYPFVVDVNGDQQFTVSDVFMWLKEVFFLPGDWLIYSVATRMPETARFLELGAADYGHNLSLLVSGVFWFALFILVIIVWRCFRAADDALTRGIRRAGSDTARRTRMAVAAFRAKMRGGAEALPYQLEFSSDVELSAQEAKLLRAHLENGKPEGLEPQELASILGMRVARTERLQKKLVQMGLIERRGSQKACGLTASGSAYLLCERLATN